MHSLLVISDGSFPDPAARAALLAGGIEAHERASDPADVVLVALPLPVDDLLRRCRELGGTAAVIVAIERRDAGLIAAGRGADDFIFRPIDTAELLARVRFQLWRTKRVEGEGVVRGGDELVIDTGRYEVTVGGRRVDLTLKEYELLLFLARHPGRVFTREILLDRIWGQHYFGGTRTVDVHVRRLRMKIERGGRAYVDTVRGVGYRFVE